MLGGCRHTFLERARLEDPIALALEDAGHQGADCRLVFYHQDALAAPVRSDRSGVPSPGGRPYCGLGGAGQIDLQSRALAGFTFDRDLAAALLDDPVDDRQAESGALFRVLGGVERLEGVSDCLLNHSRAGVGEDQHRVRAGADVGPTTVGGYVNDARSGRLDGDLPTVRHGVAGVDGQIHEHLLDLSGDGLHRHRRRIGHHHQFDVLAGHRPQQPAHVQDQSVEVEHLRGQRLPSGEGEELPRESIRPLSSRADLAESLIDDGVRFRGRLDDVRHPDDHLKQVVEVVGGPRRHA